MTRDECAELRWLAFRYVSDELTATEAEAFERRLDEDQAAREAVAEAVALTTAVASLPANTLSTLPMRPRCATVRLLIGLAAAASLLVAVGWHWRAASTDSGLALRKPSQAIVLAWTDLREDTDAVEARDGLMAWLDGPAAVDASEAADGVPDWLIAAASLPVAKEN